jgi:8-oxo-dGTP pyrophosphatase MutT (NUDIX family)
MDNKKIISAGFIIVSKDKKILLGRAGFHHPPFCWTVFKGGAEKGEDLLQTAMRELKEESGIDINYEQRLNRNISSEPVYDYALKHKNVYLFLLEDITGFLEDFNFVCCSFWEDGKPEVTDYQWFEIDELENNIFPSQRGLIDFLKTKYKKA